VSFPNRDADAIVIGAGAAGSMAALSAAHHGARVMLLERDLAGPSNFLVSGGLFPGAGTRWQKEAGIEDGPAAFARDIRDKGSDSANEAIVDAVARRSADAAHFLADVAGVPIHVMKELAAPGHRVPRLHASPAESGRELHSLLRAALRRFPGIEIVDRIETFKLQWSDAFEVTTSVKVFSAASVVLATGGFAANRKLLAEFVPAVAHALHIGAGPNDGCAIRWGRALGAAVTHMDGYQGQGHVNPGTGTRLGMALPGLGAFLVNREGRRFVREDVGPSELAALVLAQPGGVALEVFDRRIHEAAMRQEPYREAHEAGVVMVADDPALLAKEAGLPECFVDTFREFSGYVRRKADPLGHARFGPPLEPPLHAAWVTGALAHTQGGLAVDSCARVLRQDGTVIEGLYAAGGAAAGLAGRGGEGYLPGNGLAQSFALGLIAGERIGSIRARA
jgi:fumarate reductase flavoprotein subunit